MVAEEALVAASVVEVAAAFLEDSAEAAEAVAEVAEVDAEDALAAAAVAELAAFVAEVIAPWTAVMLSATVFTSVMFSATRAILLVPEAGLESTGSVMEPMSVARPVDTPRSEPTMPI